VSDRLVVTAELAEAAGVTRQAIEGYCGRHRDFPSVEVRGRRMFPFKKALAYIKRLRAIQQKKLRSGMFGSNDFYHDLSE
jgi:hypothetical protein